MTVASVAHCLREFVGSTNDSLALVLRARDMGEITTDGVLRRVGPRFIELHASLALLRIHASWESFLEDVFLRYMCGARCLTGAGPSLIGPPMPRLRDASRKLLGGLKYLSWNPYNTIRWAKTYFMNGEPFTTALGYSMMILDDMYAVRNRFVHRSLHSSTEFHSVVMRVYGYLPRGISPGRFLLSKDPSGAFGGLAFIEAYVAVLVTSGQLIVA